MRVGIFGGSFDPPHVGHLLVATDAIEALSFDRLQVVPAAVQPLKGHGRTAAAHRLAMTRGCFDGLSRVEVDAVEIDRGGLSFTVDTVETYQRLWPSAELHLLIGEDAAAGLAKWREPQRLLSMVQVVVLTRASNPDAVAAPAPGFPDSEIWVGQSPPLRLATRRVDVSSTEIRARVQAGRSIRGFVPDAVADYIASTGLYFQEPEALANPAPG